MLCPAPSTSCRAAFGLVPGLLTQGLCAELPPPASPLLPAGLTTPELKQTQGQFKNTDLVLILWIFKHIHPTGPCIRYTEEIVAKLTACLSMQRNVRVI